MMSIVKKFGVEGNGAGERGGYYWLPLNSTYTFSGTNEFFSNIPMPSPPIGGSFSARALIITSGQYLLQNAMPDYKKPVLYPSNQQNQVGALHNLTNSQCTWTEQKSYHTLYSPSYNYLQVQVFRPNDFSGIYTGTLDWTLTVRVVGVIYIRGSFYSYVYV